MNEHNQSTDINSLINLLFESDLQNSLVTIAEKIHSRPIGRRKERAEHGEKVKERDCLLS